MAQASLDDLRKAYPHLGFAAYAIEPNGPVTLEVIDGEEVYSTRAPTLAEAIQVAFPSAVNPPSAPATSVFD